MNIRDTLHLQEIQKNEAFLPNHFWHVLTAQSYLILEKKIPFHIYFKHCTTLNHVTFLPPLNQNNFSMTVPCPSPPSPFCHSPVNILKTLWQWYVLAGKVEIDLASFHELTGQEPQHPYMPEKGDTQKPGKKGATLRWYSMG